MLFTIIVILVFLASLSLHELGHAYAMQQCGVPIKRISLLGIPGMGKFQLPITSRHLPGTEWCVHPLIIGAYVEPDREKMQSLKRNDLLFVYGMGPLVNILAAIVMTMASFALSFAWNVYTGTSVQNIERTLCVLVTLGIWFTSFWYFKRWVCHFVLIPIGCLLMLMIMYVNTAKGGTFFIGMSDVFGDIYQLGIKMSGNSDSIIPTIIAATRYGALFSFFIGTTNLIPFAPLDGGQMIRAILPEKWKKTYVLTTAPLILILILLSISKDFWNLGRWIVSWFT